MGTTMSKTTAIIFKKRPEGVPTKDCVETKEIDVPEVKDGQIRIKTLWLSVDPYMRGRMNAGKSYAAPWELGEPLQGGTVSLVEESKAEGFAKGDRVVGLTAWQGVAVVDPKKAGLRKVPDMGVPFHYFLHVLGMPGLTAWWGTSNIGKLKKGETVFVSGAAGAVGSMVGQLAKFAGCRVVGTAGSDEKLKYLKELGYDAGINYKTTKDLPAAIKEHCPDGIDFYFDNVAGQTLDDVLLQMNKFGRIAFCGGISQYNKGTDAHSPKNYFQVLVKSLTWRGFLVFDHYDQYGEFIADVGKLLKEGKLKARATVTDGLDKAYDAFLGLFKGENIGKAVVKVAD